MVPSAQKPHKGKACGENIRKPQQQDSITDDELKGEEETLNKKTNKTGKRNENIMMEAENVNKLDSNVKCRNSKLNDIYVTFLCL